MPLFQIKQKSDPGRKIEEDPFCFSPNEDPFHNSMFDRRCRHFDRGGNTHWSVAWSDLMMTMFILFAVMYIYKLANKDWTYGKGPGTTSFSDAGSGVVIDQKVKETVRDSIPEIYNLTKRTIKDVGEVELIKDQQVRVTLTNDLLFETGKADLKPGAMNVLGGLASVIRQNPYIVNVVGHTDDVPIRSDQFPTNWELSAIRSTTVVRYMIEKLNIPGNRFFISAHSYYQPLKPNTDNINRALNRRVEIIITKERPGATNQ
jgi:chemotaxis protein MotB